MTRATSQNDVSRAVLKGIGSAVSKYRHMVGDRLDSAPEYFVVSSIAEALSRRIEKTWVTMEAPVKKTMENARASMRGRPHKQLSPQGRFDIVLYWKTGRPRAALEVKHPVTHSGHKGLISDLRRLCATLKRSTANDGTIQLGMLAYYLSSGEPKKKDNNATARIRRQRLEIETRLRKFAEKKHCRIVPHYGRTRRLNDGAWMACCIRVQRKRSDGD
jgi:hypothetical protein